MKSFFPYHRRHPLALARLFLQDLYYWFYASLFRRNIALPKALNRILLVNPAHLGDVVISTAILRELRNQFPECVIDFLVGDWASPLVQGHPGINRAFFIGHWQANRGGESLSSKKIKYQYQVTQVMGILKNQKYDAVFFLNSYEPSFIALFKKFQCPLAGLTSAGGGPLLSYVGDESAVHEVQIQASLFTPWLGKFKEAPQYKPWLKNTLVTEDFKASLGLSRPYIVIHPGSGNPAKEWPIENWIEVKNALTQFDLDIVITGHGEREKNLASQLLGDRSINLVGKLNFDQFTSVVEGAKAVLCVDSLAGHIAGAYDKNVVIIGNGLSNIERWHPLGKNSQTFVKKMSCSPCHSHPCAQRTCITSITPQMVINHLSTILGNR